MAVAACVLATPAGAHGFGQRYELPVPLSLYLLGAAAAVALSFAVLGLFVRHTPVARAGKRYDLLSTPIGRAIAHPAVLLALRTAVLGLFIVTVLAGLIGAHNPYRNIAPTLVWIVWWVGLAYVQAFVGDLWRLINPWRTVYDAANWLYRRLGWGSGLSLRLPYPSWLGAWPACLLLLGFSWIELISPNAAEPAFIARLAIGYSILTWAGMLAFGRDAWLQHGEVFSLVFGTLARFAPTEARDDRLLLRPFGAGLLEAPPLSTSMMAFVLLLLATVLYDGLIGTGEWAMLEEGLRPFLPVAGDAASTAIRTVGLVAIWLIFLAAYIGISALHEPARRWPSGHASRSRSASPSRWCRSPSATTWPTTWCSCWCRASTSFRFSPTRSATAGTCSEPADIASTSVSWEPVSRGTRPLPRSSSVTSPPSISPTSRRSVCSRRPVPR